MPRKKGFTLIEVLIVIIILGILATLAMPQFAGLAKRAYFAESWTGLSAMRTAMEIYKVENGNYAGATVANIPFTTPTGAVFAYSIASVDATNYNLLATGSGKAAGLTAWVTEDGVKGNAGA